MFLKLQWEASGSSRVSKGTSGKSGLLSSCEGHCRIPLELLPGNGVSSPNEAGNSGFLSSCNRDLWVSTEFKQGSQTLSHF